MLAIPKSVLKKVKGAAVIPVGVHTQYTIDEEGLRKVKRRTTHDASFPPPSALLVNNRMIRELLTECFYGHCLFRVFHNIHTMRVKHPKLRILLLKLYFDAVHRRLHVTAMMTLLTITVIDELAYILLRLPFGVANGRNDFSIVSESIFDLINDILRDKTYDPTNLNTHFNYKFGETATTHEEDTPFGKARSLFVKTERHPTTADG